jgi:hypothetical protein
MRTVLKPFAVLTLTSCLTTLQFSTLAWAQQPTELKTGKAPLAATHKKAELATPSLLVAPQSGFEVSLGYTRSQVEFQQKKVDGKAETAIDAGETVIAYGLNPNLYFGAKIDYMSSKTKADMAIMGFGSIQQTTIEGIGDPTLQVGSRLNFGELSVLGSLGYMIPSGTAEVQVKSNQSTEYSNKKGGGEIHPQISVFRNNKSEILFGGTAEYVIRENRKLKAKDFNGFSTDLSETGGNAMILTAIVETPQTTHSMGATLQYEKDASVSRTSLKTIDVAGNEIATATVYGNIQIAKNSISVLPALGYTYFINDKLNDTELSSQSSYFGSLKLKMTF